MKPLYDQSEFSDRHSKKFFPLECYQCHKSFLKPKYEIQKCLVGHKGVSCKYCSRSCSYKSKITTVKLNCKLCNKIFDKLPNQIKKTKNHFCSRSCSATHHNSTHKPSGSKRSKLELHIEKFLKEVYPNLEILYNDINTIKMELDIFIPSINLAFELNGIFHYKPIHGQDKLIATQKNDTLKITKCSTSKIKLIVLNTSGQRKFSIKSSKIYLDEILTSIKRVTDGI